MVKWLKPPANSIKLNSDGASKGNPGPAGGGCILRDHTGNMVYALSNFYGLCSTIPMEHTELVDALTEYKIPDQNQISDMVVEESFVEKAGGATLAVGLSDMQDVFTFLL